MDDHIDFFILLFPFHLIHGFQPAPNVGVKPKKGNLQVVCVLVQQGEIEEVWVCACLCVC